MKSARAGLRDLGCGGAKRDARGERGAVAVIVALSFTVLMGFFILAVQTGHLGMARGMLQGSADQAALAAASQLDGSIQGFTDAKNEAKRMLRNGRNLPLSINGGNSLSIAGNAFQTGTWDLEKPGLGFTPTADESLANAVRVVARKTKATNGPVQMFLSGGMWGPESVEIERAGIAAVGNCASLPCKPDVPMAVCQESLRCGEEMRVMKFPNNTDNGAWSSLSVHKTNANGLKDYIDDCEEIPDVRQGDCINLNNGQINSVQGALKRKFDEWQAANPCPNVRLPDLENGGCDPETCGPNTAGDPVDINGDGMVDSNDCGMLVGLVLIPCSADIRNSCTGDTDTLGPLNQSRQVTGFVPFVITGVKDKGNPKFIDGYPLCGVQVGGASTGPGPSCSDSSPTCCSTQPILVNKNVT